MCLGYVFGIFCGNVGVIDGSSGDITLNCSEIIVKFEIGNVQGMEEGIYSFLHGTRLTKSHFIALVCIFC